MDFSFAPGEDLDDLGTTVTKYDNNLQALRILKELETEGRTEATLHEQTILARYTGWGDSTLLKRLFPGGNATHIPPAEDLQELVTPDELKALRSSALNAHYTSLPVIRAIYAGLKHIGLHLLHQEKGVRQLRVLEPAVGVGHFLGAMPHELKERSECAAVELDPLSARITKLLYPNARLFAEGFETANLPSNWFDLCVSNVPFGNYKVCDPSVKEHYLRASIHDYFFTKALRVTRPGGIVAFITSRFTLDKQDTRVRLYLATHAELLVCVRLPNDAFTRNAGTQVVTDILILRKRAAPDREAAARESWVQAEETTVMHEAGTPMNIMLNRSFIADPTLMLGQPIVGPHGMYGRNEFTIKGDGRNLGECLTRTLHRILPRDLLAVPTTSTGIAGENVVPTPTSQQEPDLLEFMQQQEFSGMSEARASIEQARAQHLLDIYTAAKEVIRMQVDGEGDEQLQTAQAELNRLYDRFRIRYGYINSKQNLAAFHRHNSLLAFLRALEEPTRFGGAFRKAPLFTERTIRPLRGQAEPQGAAEALLLSLNEHGSTDLAVIAASCRKTTVQVREELRGLIFQTPSGEWMTRDEYLSGNVFVRLREAEAAAELDPTFQENVEALRAAQPTLLGAGEITARLGAAWVPEAVIETFARALVPRYTGKIKYLAPTAQWIVEPPSWDTAATIEATQQWGTNRVHALDILDDALNLRRTIVFDQVDEKTRVVNRTETISAQAKLDDMKEKFLEWVWQDATREKELCRLYNEQFNCVRERCYDGSHLTLPGASTKIELRPAQKDAVWRILQSKTTLVAHTVGAGKTLTAIAAAVELRRLKFAQKSMIVVPKHVVPQWAAEADKLYSGLKMLTTDARDFTRERRGETMSRIATGDWDLIIIPHPSFKLLPVKDETANRFINDEMERLRGYISELKDDDERGNRRSIKSMEKTLKRFEAKLKCAESEIRHDDKDTITFEEMGVEALFVDEFQSYKNLYFPTKMSRVPGLANSESQQAFDMFIKSQWLLGQGGRFIGLTGTPISNTLCEGYVMMRYFQLDLLRELGLDHFDSWAQSFGETVTGVEMRPDGSGFRVNTRFAKFVNLAELARLQRMCWDVRTPEQLNLPRPDLAGGSPITVAVPASPELIEFVGELSRRSELVSARRVCPSEDNMLKITSEGRKAALDMRLVRPEFGELPVNKIDALVERIGRLWQRTHANRGAQIVFCDLSTPKSRGGVNASRPDIENGAHTEEQELDLAA